jgi:DNA-binding NtrC family response regulator
LIERTRPLPTGTRSVSLETLTDVFDTTGLREVTAALDPVAATDVAVLIRGESGVGKETVAKAIHARSPRAMRPFVKVNCAALPDGLLESELFGHEAGSFTGAATLRIGKFEQANEGTLMLDEIGDLRAPLQSKLLQVLQDGSFSRIGSNQTIAPDVRVITATNANLEQMMRRGDFREDLYYRLRVIEVQVPPLRACPADVLRLTDLFLHKFAGQYGRPVPTCSAAFKNRLQHYRWPGNVRELENMAKALVVLQDENLLQIGPSSGRPPLDGAVSPATGDSPRPNAADGSSAGQPGNNAEDGIKSPERREAVVDVAAVSLPEVARAAITKVEREMIISALDRVYWNRRKAAPLLGINYKTLLNKLREYNLEPE